MSIRVMTRVWDHADAAGGELLVLLALADFADDDGFSYPTPAQVASKARLSDRQVRTVLQSLESRGELAYHIGRGRSARSWFVVLVGLADDEKAHRRAGLEDRRNRQSLPDLSPQFRKKLPEISSGFRAKSGSLPQLNPEVSSLNPEVSSNENAGLGHPDASNGTPNHHDPSWDPSDHDLPPPSAHAMRSDSGGGGGEGETQAILRAARVEADFADIPAAVARAAVATARAHPEAATKLPRLVAGLLKRYRAGRWAPPERSHDGRPDPGADGPHRDELRAVPPDRGAGGRGGGLPGADGRGAGADHAGGLEDAEPTAEQLAEVRRAATERFERLQRTRC